jgi:uncharacterized protein
LGDEKVYFCAHFQYTAMEIKVSDIQPEGLAVEFTQGAADFADLGGDMKVLGPVEARFRLRKTGATVTIDGKVDARLELVCSRCGKPCAYEAGSVFQLDLNPVQSLTEEEENELRPDELEIEFYRGDIIDLSGLLREQMLLQVPMKPLCKDDCLGLCQFCGQDMNESRCGCDAATGHPGLAGLKDLFKDKK